MAPSRERDSHRHQSNRQQQSFQPNYSSRRENKPISRPRIRNSPRRDYRRSRDEPTSRRLSSRDSYFSRRPGDSNPFRKTDRSNSRRFPDRNYAGRRPARIGQKWLPPIRNPARYISQSEKTSSRDGSENERYPVRELTPIPESRRRGSRSRSPIESRTGEKNGSRREGPRTPPPEHESSDHDGIDEEQEILDIVHNMFNICYQEVDKDTQINRFNWLKEKILDIQNEIEDLRHQGPQIDDLELIDSTDRNNREVEHDQNGEELDYEPDTSFQDDIKSPMFDNHQHSDNNKHEGH